MLWSPVVVNTKADLPSAKLLFPSVIEVPADEPNPVLLEPVVIASKAA